MLVVLQSIGVLLLIYVGAVLIGKLFVDLGTSTPVTHKIEVIFRLPLSKEVKCIDCLFVQQQKVYVILN